MPDWREFNASNDEDTCIWCGKKLRRRMAQHAIPEGVSWEEWHAQPKAEKMYPVYDKPGDYGDGFFCGLRCGYLFGERMAELGRRLESK